ncbi:MAG: hypothetical protein ACR2O3_15240 [Rhizobiaceae bacterium]
MRIVFATMVAVLFSGKFVLANECHDRFVDLLINGNEKGPVTIQVTQEVKGAPVSKSVFYQAVTGHWMTEMVEPENQDWVLTYNDTMYTSSDKGKSWNKIRTLDSANNEEVSRKNLVENSATARNAVCGQEEIDGIQHETVEADYDTLQNFRTENHFKYWINPETGWITKATYLVKGQGFESFTTQFPVPAPDLELPMP